MVYDCASQSVSSLAFFAVLAFFSLPGAGFRQVKPRAKQLTASSARVAQVFQRAFTNEGSSNHTGVLMMIWSSFNKDFWKLRVRAPKKARSIFMSGPPFTSVLLGNNPTLLVLCLYILGKHMPSFRTFNYKRLPLLLNGFSTLGECG